jgi:two-component system, LytTR family, sensor kinase
MRWTVRLLVVLVSLGSLMPLGRLVADWVQVVQLTGESPLAAAPRGFDWVHWEEVDGEIVATFVYPGGSAHAAGLPQDAILYQVEFQQFFSAEDVKQVVEGVRPGRTLTYDVVVPQPDGSRQPGSYEVLITRYPTFLYPLSRTLWLSAIWGFGLAAFLHVLGLAIVAPLALRSRRARRTTVLFAAATLWVVGNLGRLLAVTLLGPPTAGVYATAFQALTLLALSGWVLFPALLLHAVASDLRAFRARAGIWYTALFFPPIILGLTTVGLILGGSIGPLTLDTLIAPILFYVCCYVAASTALTLAAGAFTPARPGGGRREEVPAATAWSRAGSTAVLLLATTGALSVMGVAPIPGALQDATVGWLILLIQLLSLAPVGLVSLATLRHGRAETVLSGALAYLAVLGAVFFLVLAGLLLIERQVMQEAGWTHALAGSLYVLFVLVLVERVVQALRRRTGRWLMTERQRARERLRQFGERMRFILDPTRLAEATVQAVGEAMDAHSAVLFLRDPATPAGGPNRWIRASYRPEPPFFTEAELGRVWAHLQAAGTVWARNAELDESTLPAGDARLLERHGAALAIPVAGGETEPAGLLVLGRRSRRRAVYNLEDVAQLRALAGQLALATERLALIEREKALVRETAQAQLTALRAQINPHFLFNTLNTIAALIDERPAEAERVVERLARIFRHILQTEDRTFVPLADEVRLVRDYLTIEQARFGEKLRVIERWDPDLMDVPVPAFTLQTLVENAVKHGIERQRGGGTLELASRALPDEHRAVLSVADSGVGIPALFEMPAGDGAAPLAEHDFFGIGLQNVADRLERLYGRRDLLRFSSGRTSGTRAEISIPLAPHDP